MRRFNLRRSLQRLRGSIYILNEKETVPVRSLLQYCFANYDHSDTCHTITKDIQNELLETLEDTRKSPLYCYRLIKTSKLHNDHALVEQIQFFLRLTLTH